MLSLCNQYLYEKAALPVFKEGSCLIGESKISTPLLNGVIGGTLKVDEIQTTVEKIFKHFTDKKLPHSWWIEKTEDTPELQEALEKRGLKRIGEFPGMRLEIDAAVHPKSDEGTIFEQVKNDKSFLEWSTVLCQAFEFSDDVSEKYAAIFKNAPSSSRFIHLVGRKEEKAVVSGTVLCLDKIAYIYNVGTLATERKKGHASRMTSELIKIAQQNGCREIGLISSPQASPVYKSLGFKQECEYRIYL